jgi:hypothetical protein
VAARLPGGALTLTSWQPMQPRRSPGITLVKLRIVCKARWIVFMFLVDCLDGRHKTENSYYSPHKHR